MIRKLKFLLPYLPYFIVNKIKRAVYKRELAIWHKKGCPVPPPHLVKQMAIAEYQKKYNYSILVETGTYIGEMVEAQKENFKQIFSIEIGDDLFEKAKKRFAKDRNVQIIHGDSGTMLPKVVSGITEPAIFWLDGHYSHGITAMSHTECPIFEELDALFNKSKNFSHILLIDDARCFIGKDDYPTIEKLTEYVKAKNPAYKVDVKDDIIRYVASN